MPLFDYQCLHCGHIISDVLQRNDEENLKFCPECAGEIKKLVGVANFLLKGDGWFKPSAINEKSESE